MAIKRVRWLLRTCLIAGFLLLLQSGCNKVPVALGGSRFRLVIGSKGHDDGQFNRPRGITFDVTRDEFFVVDWDGRVQHFTLDGKWLNSWFMPEVINGKPEEVFLTPEDTILVADTHYSQILEYSRDGELLNRFGELGTEPGQFIYPVGVCMDPEGFVWVSEYGQNDRVQKLTREGMPILVIGETGYDPGQFQRPSGIKVSDDRLLYVADAVNHRVQVFSLEGELVRVIGEEGRGPGQFLYPYDLAIRENALYVLEYGGQRIQKLTLTGEFLDSYGERGSGDGQFAAPWRMTDYTDGLLVSDTNNNRVILVHF